MTEMKGEKEMTIRQNVKRVKGMILQDIINDQRTFTREVQDKAVRAILKGFGDNAECQEYFSLFATTPAELDRLLGRDGTTGPAHAGRDRARAYLMSNGPCGSGTVLNFENTVTSNLD